MNAKVLSIRRSAEGREGENTRFRPVRGDWRPEVRGARMFPQHVQCSSVS